MYELSPLRQRVLDEAQSWVGTKFHHMAQLKGVGVDCGQLLLGVYSACGCMPKVDPGYYPPDFHMHQSLEWYANILGEYCVEFDGEGVLPADIVLFRMIDARVFSHGGIVVEWPWIIHAAFARRRVVRDSATNGWLKMLRRRFFRPRAFVDEVF